MRKACDRAQQPEANRLTDLQELVEHWEERPRRAQQQGQHGLRRVHVQAPLVTVLSSEWEARTW